MAFPNVPIANGKPSSSIFYDGKKSLFGKNIHKGDPLNNVLCVLDELLEQLYKSDLLDCIDLKDLGITCIDKDADKRCVIMEWMVKNMNAANNSISQLLNNIQIIQTTIGNLSDEKVKVRAAGGTHFLEDIISAPPSTLEVTNDKITFLGFVPVGFRGTVSINRIGDFDNTGKGLPNTDMWGWAIRNGLNGLPNHFGLFPMYVSAIAEADLQGGVENFTVSKDNISSFSLPVTGLISESLENGIRIKVGIRHYRSFDGNNGVGNPIKDTVRHGNDTPWYSDPINLRHSHGFNLNVSHANATPTPINLIPKHIKEIPIERIIP